MCDLSVWAAAQLNALSGRLPPDVRSLNYFYLDSRDSHYYTRGQSRPSNRKELKKVRKIIWPLAAIIGVLLLMLSFAISSEATCRTVNCLPGEGACNLLPGRENNGCRDEAQCTQQARKCYWHIGKCSANQSACVVESCIVSGSCPEPGL